MASVIGEDYPREHCDEGISATCMDGCDMPSSHKVLIFHLLYCSSFRYLKKNNPDKFIPIMCEIKF